MPPKAKNRNAKGYKMKYCTIYRTTVTIFSLFRYFISWSFSGRGLWVRRLCRPKPRTEMRKDMKYRMDKRIHYNIMRIVSLLPPAPSRGYLCTSLREARHGERGRWRKGERGGNMSLHCTIRAILCISSGIYARELHKISLLWAWVQCNYCGAPQVWCGDEMHPGGQCRRMRAVWALRRMPGSPGARPDNSSKTYNNYWDN